MAEGRPTHCERRRLTSWIDAIAESTEWFTSKIVRDGSLKATVLFYGDWIYVSRSEVHRRRCTLRQ